MLYDNIAIVGLAHVDAPIELASAAIEDQLSETMTRLNIHQGLLEGLSGIGPVDSGKKASSHRMRNPCS